MKEKIMKELECRLEKVPHVWKTKGITLAEWWEMGRPCMWTIAMVDGQYTFLGDEGFGLIALFDAKDSSLALSHSGIVVSSDQKMVGLSESYGLSKLTLFKAVE